jgi:hypothetical protein
MSGEIDRYQHVEADRFGGVLDDGPNPFFYHGFPHASPILLTRERKIKLIATRENGFKMPLPNRWHFFASFSR